MSRFVSRAGAAKAFCLGVVLFVPLHFLFSGPSAEKDAGGSGREKQVVVSTSWVAAMAEAAGARNVRILAPMELRHPPEYELKPSDLFTVSKADMVVYAGWEMFAQKLAETAGNAEIRMVTVTTSNKPEDFKAEARKLAELFGTVDRFEAWEKGFDALTDELRGKILAVYPDRRAVVERMHTPFAEWLGLDIVGEYGPAEPSPGLILSLVQTGPALVIDNYHAPSGYPIAEAARAPYGELINFPGRGGTRTIEDVFRYNADVLINAAASRSGRQ
ncbi:MAG: metal ABC transporter substrate-binding protein [Spirochaetaceae bacterium]|jgi:hypothetical protein|nr:metal ABC transporter substrate-binding protein [Spirochaetaceae bacterium]